MSDTDEILKGLGRALKGTVFREAYDKFIAARGQAQLAKAPPCPECPFCGGAMSKNPHPNAGKYAVFLEVGTAVICIPCTVKSRHQWAERAMKAEGELASRDNQVKAQEREAIIKWVEAKYLNNGMGLSKSYSRTARCIVAKDLVLNLIVGLKEG